MCMRFLAFIKRFSSAFSIITTCIGLLGLALYFYYQLAYGLSLFAAGMAISSVFQVIRLWNQDKARAMIMLITSVVLIAMVVLYF